MSLEEITKKRVLIADDDDDVLKPAARYFSLKGWVVDTASTVEDAIEKYKTQKDQGKNYDVIITDNNMPKENAGVEFIKKIREDEQDGTTLLCLRSGTLDETVINSVKNYSNVLIFEKMTSLQTMYDEIYAALQKTQ